MSDQEILQRIKEDNTKVISHVYMRYHDEFVRFVRNGYPQFSVESAEDAYSECFHALYRNVKVGKLVSLTCSLKSYLFQIGKYKVIDEMNRKCRLEQNEMVQYLPSNEMLELDFFEEEDEQIKKTRLLHEIIGMLTDSCKKLLKLFWFDQKKDSEIVDLMNYTSTDTIKNQRSRCMKTLKEKYLTKLVAEKVITNSKKKRLIGE